MGYHAIYNIEWLGWDLVEPLTYTIGQGSFILGMLAIARSRMQMKSAEYSDMENYWTEDKLKQIYQKKGNIHMVQTRYVYLQDQLNHLQKELD